MYAETMARCWGCGGPFGNCWCVAESMRAYKEALEIDRSIRVSVARKSVPPAPRRRAGTPCPRCPERVVTTATRATAMRHYAGR